MTRSERDWLLIQLARAELFIAAVTNASVGGTTLESLDLAAASWLDSGAPDEIEEALAVAYGQYLVDLSGSQFQWFIDEHAQGRGYILQGPFGVNINFWQASRNRLRSGGLFTFKTLAALHVPLVDVTAAMPMTVPSVGTPPTKPWWAFWR